MGPVDGITENGDRLGPRNQGMRSSDDGDRRPKGRNYRMSELEVPEPDAFEQALEVTDQDGGLDRPSSDLEVPEADALEQAQREPLEDEPPL